MIVAVRAGRIVRHGGGRTRGTGLRVSGILGHMSDRGYPPRRSGDREMLLGWLAFHRATLAAKCEDLTDEQLRRRSVPPSTLSLLGLVRHLAEVERGWLPPYAGEALQPLYCTEGSPDGDFDDVENAEVEASFEAWRAECDHSDDIISRADSLDASEDPGSDEAYSLRWILLHVLEEYARHNGHADLLRQSIDGSVGV